MYDELVKRLKNCATQAAPCETCGLIEDGSCSDTLMKQAADAIEELSKRVPPVPHGRLIDADALKMMWDDEIARLLEKGIEYLDYHVDTLFSDFKHDVDKTPTVIPASEEGE